jgi:hypothetical protein
MAIKVMAAVWETDLDQTKKLVMLALADWSNDAGECWPHLSTIAAKCSISERTVSRTISELVKGEWIEKKNFGRGGTIYYINLPVLGLKKGSQSGRFPMKKGSQSGCLSTGERSPSDAKKVAICDTPIYNHHEPLEREVLSPEISKIQMTEQGWFLAWWKFSFQTITGQPYFPGGKDTGIISGLVKNGGLIEVMKRACSYLMLPANKRFPKNESPQLVGLQQMINGLAESYSDDIEWNCVNKGLLPNFDLMPVDFNLTDFRPWEK